MYALCYAILLAQRTDPENVRLKFDRFGVDGSEYLREYLIEVVQQRQLLAVPIEDDDSYVYVG